MIHDTAADALFVAERIKSGRTQVERIRSVLEIAEPLLGVDRDAGQRGYIRKQQDNWLFITRDTADTIYFPLQAPPQLRGRPRYRWIDGPTPDIRLGFLTETAREFQAQEITPSYPGT